MISRWSLAYSSATCRASSERDGCGFSSVVPWPLAESQRRPLITIKALDSSSRARKAIRSYASLFQPAELSAELAPGPRQEEAVLLLHEGASLLRPDSPRERRL